MLALHVPCLPYTCHARPTRAMRESARTLLVLGLPLSPLLSYTQGLDFGTIASRWWLPICWPIVIPVDI